MHIAKYFEMLIFTSMTRHLVKYIGPNYALRWIFFGLSENKEVFVSCKPIIIVMVLDIATMMFILFLKKYHDDMLLFKFFPSFFSSHFWMSFTKEDHHVTINLVCLITATLTVNNKCWIVDRQIWILPSVACSNFHLERAKLGRLTLNQ